VRRRLDACDALLAAGEPDEAVQCAKQVQERHPAVPRAFLIRGKAYCELDDQAMALAMTRSLASRPKLRRALVAHCAREGYGL
jgi:hypothetical protein